MTSKRTQKLLQQDGWISCDLGWQWQQYNVAAPAGSEPSIVVLGGSYDASSWRYDIKSLLFKAGFGIVDRESEAIGGGGIRGLADLCRRDPKAAGAGIALITADHYRWVETRTGKSIKLTQEYRTSRKDILAAKRLLSIMPHERCVIISPSEIDLPNAFYGVRHIRYTRFQDVEWEMIDHLIKCNFPCKPIPAPVEPDDIFAFLRKNNPAAY